ncbi:MAG: AMP-binding protein [Mogibacterium sp.]|nr:AMP-binding protein [Mogibacterium sp.]
MERKKKVQEVVNELDLMTEEEYQALKEAEMAEMKVYADGIKNSSDPKVMYRIGRPITDLKQMFESSVELFGDRPLYHQIMKGDKEFSIITYKEALRQVRGLGTALLDLGLKGSHIGIIGPNCYEWVESYHAILGGIGVGVPLDKELSKDELANLCNEGDIKAIICCADRYYNIFKEILEEGKTGLRYVIGVAKEVHEDPKKGLYSWNLLQEAGMAKVDAGDTRFHELRIRNTALAVIIFTSGTTGVAKGVMLSHKNLCFDILSAQAYLEVRPDDIFFSILPIHHTYECTCTNLEGMYMGASMAFCRGIKYITKDMSMVKPTFLLAVPLIYEKFYNNIIKALEKEGKLKQLRALFALNRVTSKVGINVSRSVIERITAQFGGRIRMFIAGGAKVDPDVLQFFRDLGIKTLQGYGLTETAPMVALTPDQWQYMNNESAGRVLQYTDYKIEDPDEEGNGEICFRGPQVMLGYYNNPEATEACMEDEWFHTGDLGHIDDDRYVFITGRKKNVIIAPNGKNVFPEELEEKLMRSPYIEECMVWGDDQENICVTIRVDKEHARAILGEELTEESVMELINGEVEKMNSAHPNWKKIKRINIRRSDFIKTTSQKIKRFVTDNKLGDIQIFTGRKNNG